MLIPVLSALFLSSIAPAEPSSSLARADRQAIVESLSEAIDAYHFSPDVRARYRHSLETIDIAQAPAGPAPFALFLHRRLQAVEADGHMGVYGPDRTAGILGTAEFRDEESAHVSGEPSDLQGPDGDAIEQGRSTEQSLPEVAPGIRLWRLEDFSTDTLDRVGIESRLGALRSGEALILDLRDNRGGEARLFRWMAGCLFAEPTPVYAIEIRIAEGSQLTRRGATPSAACRSAADRPMAVLVNGMTASTAELAAFVLQARGRARIIGSRTYGASHAAEFYPLAHGFGAMIPIGRTFDPLTGDDWEGNGVVPDLPVDPDGALDAAIADLAIRTGP